MRTYEYLRLGDLDEDDITHLEGLIHRLGYSNKDYRINHFSNKCGMIVSNRNLHRDMKVIRKTKIRQKICIKTKEL